MRQFTHIRHPRGFSLMELVAVVMVIGILGALAVPTVVGVVDKASAQKIYTVSQKFAETHSLMTQTFKTSKVATATGIPNTNNNMLDVLIHGRSMVAAAFMTKYEIAGISPLTTSVVTTIQPTSGSNPGAYELEGYPVTFSTPNAYTAHVVLSAVPSRIIKLLWASHSNAAFDESATVTAGPVQHTAVSTGLHTLTLEFPI